MVGIGSGSEPPLGNLEALSRWLDSPETQTHVIRWSYDSGTLKGRLHCSSDADALCRLVATDPACECEFISVLRDELGRPYHLAEPDWQGGTRQRHDMAPLPQHCNIVLSANESDFMEIFEGEFVIGETAVAITFYGDSYDWRPLNHE